MKQSTSLYTEIHQSKSKATIEILLGPGLDELVPVDGDVLVELLGKVVDCEGADVVGFKPVAGIYINGI